MKELFHFLQYHNAVPIALGVLFLGAGATFAAANPEAIYSAQEQVLSIDNTYIVGKDLSQWSPQIRINTVTEDEEYYHVGYSLATIDLESYTWRDVTKAETMKVSKDDLGQYRDLGVYVTQQLRQIIEREHQRLADTQEFEKRQVSQAVVATTYGGLVGQFLDDTTETLPGYTPVVQAPSSVVAGAFSGPSEGGGQQQGGTGASGGGSSAQVGLQVLGNNPARILLGSRYADLGVALIDPLQTNVGVHTFVDGVEVVTPSLDTSTTTSYAIEYRVTDLDGVSIMVRRIVLIGDASDPGGEINEAGNLAPVAPPTQQSSQSAQEPTQGATTTASAQVATSTVQETSAPETATSTASSTSSASTTPPTETTNANSATATSSAETGAVAETTTVATTTDPVSEPPATTTASTTAQQ